jgi:hypothetical protein
MAVVVTAGQRGDSPQFISVLAKVRFARTGGGRPRTRPADSTHRASRPRNREENC